MTPERAESEVLNYGWGNVRPKLLQICNNPKCFLVSVVLFALTQGATVGGYANVVLPAIEKRFQFSSREIGFIAASNDISAIILTSLVSFYGGHGNIPRWLGFGSLMTGLSCLLHALPHYLIGPYDPDQDLHLVSRTPLCLSNSTTKRNSSQCISGYGGNFYNLMIFSIAQMFMGAGTTPLYSLAPAYLDENVHPKACPLYLGVFFAASIMGPGLGFVGGGAALGKYVDWKLPKGLKLSQRDPRWIGAWWLGYVIGGFTLIVLFMFLLGFPRQLPGAREMREKAIKDGQLPAKDENIKPSLKGIIPATIQLLKNPIFVFNSLALTASTIIGGGIAPFIVKILSLKFGISPLTAGMVLGAGIVPGCGTGIILGGFLVRRFNLKESLVMAAKCCLILEILNMLGGFIWTIPGCEDVQMVGIVKPYWGSSTLDTPLNAACNVNCSCSVAQIRPVCGVDKLSYFSPCFAGCTSSDKKGVYSNCACLPPSLNVTEQRAVRGFCDRGSGCNNYLAFLAVLVVLLLTGFMVAVPNKTVILRSVADNQRAYALGFQFIFQRSLGFLPGPLLFGWLVDSLCYVWGQSCGRRGSCQFYDVNRLSYRLTYIGLSVQCTSALFYFISYWFCKRKDQETSKMNKAIVAPEGGYVDLVVRETVV